MVMKPTFLHALLLLISLLSASNHVYAAGSATAQGTMSATVSNTCKVPSGATLTFGSFNPINQTTNVDVTVTFTIQCTTGAIVTDVDIGPSANGGSDGSTGSRKMKRVGSSVTCSATIVDADCLSYSLYRDSNRTTNWGNIADANFPNLTGLGFGTGNELTLTVYGRIPATSNITNTTKPGTYSDTLQVTINY